MGSIPVEDSDFFVPRSWQTEYSIFLTSSNKSKLTNLSSHVPREYVHMGTEPKIYHLCFLIFSLLSFPLGIRRTSWLNMRRHILNLCGFAGFRLRNKDKHKRKRIYKHRETSTKMCFDSRDCDFVSRCLYKVCLESGISDSQKQATYSRYNKHS